MANPFVELKDVPKNELPEFREYAFDFSKDEFIVENGRLAIVTQKEAIKVWAYKALITERYRYRAYFDDYGAELEHFVGTVTNDGAEAIEVFRYIEEALLVNPYITDVNVLGIEQNKKKITLNIELITIYGDTMLGIEV
ncbi:DUF2634 domain-containing protein [Megasphaera massiliensis]|uniref:DUF2634 domain-containing protein n=1 Tax=Megasphaera massiliensis TaxID=1232428 RepID=UPI00041A1272|nr:DUF2634 domain-containing protein [Megasphaera massiliensis]DAF84462.1 MAG TPA: Protein of unknown function (DUF2634) [Caudoviricetes sp.]